MEKSWSKATSIISFSSFVGSFGKSSLFAGSASASFLTARTSDV